MCVNVQPRRPRSPAPVLLAGRVTSLFTEPRFSNNKLKITVLKLALSSFKMWFPNGCAQAAWEQVLQPRLLLLRAQLQQLVQAQSCHAKCILQSVLGAHPVAARLLRSLVVPAGEGGMQ